MADTARPSSTTAGESAESAPDAETLRIREMADDFSGWRGWGPYLSDRSWGTVREDYSANGDAWGYLTYDQSRAKAYRWGEDGIAGLSDRYQVLCFAPSFWNGCDPHLKERLFGLTHSQGNHGEDVKEYFFHVDNTPTHSFMALLYRYPQRAFPYAELVAENNRRRGPYPEYELVDTGSFANNKYFDILIEYAKLNPEEIAIRITATNHGPSPAPLHVLPTLWFRNTWSWQGGVQPQPVIQREAGPHGTLCLLADDTNLPADPQIPTFHRLGRRWLVALAAAGAGPLFTDNETNGPVVFGPGHTSRSPFTKDAFHRLLCAGEEAACNPVQEGTKAAIDFEMQVPAGGASTLHLLLTNRPPAEALADIGLATLVDQAVALRRGEADAFYKRIAPAAASADRKQVQRAALAGLLWSKQSYIFDVAKWLDGDNPDCPPPASRRTIRNSHWRHLNSMRVLLMPDAWEYPWFAAWDLAFHCIPMALVDPQFAKDQLWLLLFEQFQHPSGQLPAYEWEFGDLNPPVHAWAVWRVYNMEKRRFGQIDRPWLERCFHKLLLVFTSWVNKVDREGNNVFEGGFLGLDNISVFDRSDRLPDGSTLEQADATGWMGMFCLNMMRIALELAVENPVYESLASKFLQHYVHIAHAMKNMSCRGYSLFDETDGFFYDVLKRPDGQIRKFHVRSLVGLIPLFAVERLEAAWIEPFKEFSENLRWFLRNRPDLVADVIHPLTAADGTTTHLLTIMNIEQLTRMLTRLHDPEEFLSPYGIRSLSKRHEHEPFDFDGRRVGYEPAESQTKLKGGNSNWRGPIWFPTTFLIVESLRKLGTAFGPDFTVRTAGAGGQPIALREMARDIAGRLTSIYLQDDTGRRPAWGQAERFQDDPRWRDQLLFFEYFHGDTGAGLGASHQTGWTALIANLIDEWR